MLNLYNSSTYREKCKYFFHICRRNTAKSGDNGLNAALLTVPVGAAAVAGGTGEDGLTWPLDDQSVLTITGSGCMADYGDGKKDTAPAPWHAYAADVK